MKQSMGCVCAVSLAILACFVINVIKAEESNDKKLLSDALIHSLTKREVREPPLEHDYDKRSSWQKASGMWGKRSDGLDSYWSKRGWEKGAGLWGKRGDSWTKASGMWGKRALTNDFFDGYSGEINGYGNFFILQRKILQKELTV